ncbi:Origin recognition complex subunit 2 [Frankliniella fusca]|uniref:Origin recognition complex subunit 2 n=1 Tax=Frankliniella fusca TaxID=407009 RepID=A0AAE1H8I9_9NEOP|nr:Origin recognition complex subunit 2 [Frankliniella fusca]KAK3916465.1 Origin recognition complex subunit 2 [Frankliniella fusca]KAK3919246.1 Origin recognition complex subunit 2 [Frankliniella fusca]KAK3919248.1 Origin recognition complex subunit 2 [Frankliniella fusca]
MAPDSKHLGGVLSRMPVQHSIQDGLWSTLVWLHANHSLENYSWSLYQLTICSLVMLATKEESLMSVKKTTNILFKGCVHVLAYLVKCNVEILYQANVSAFY